jgi:hypothetical protein
MEFDYAKREWSGGILYVPTLPVWFNNFPISSALVDTGADVTILPMELNQILNVEVDLKHPIVFTGAGGGKFEIFPAKEKVEYRIEKGGFRPITWKGTVFFAHNEPTILLGQFECLSELSLILDGKRRKISVSS